MFFALAASPQATTAELNSETLEDFDRYIREAETRMDARLRGGPFLWTDEMPARAEQLRTGRLLSQPWNGKGEVKVRSGLIHDWIGAVFIPHATLAGTLAMVQNYDQHKKIYKPEVIDSRLLGRNGNDFQVFLRLLKHKVLTVVLNSNHDVRYFPVSSTRCYSRSYSTKIAEVQDFGKPDQRELEPGHGHGFLWRLYSYWRFEERDGGVYVECRAISLTRDVPAVIAWMINPIVRSLPRESLANTLRATRDALATSITSRP